MGAMFVLNPPLNEQVVSKDLGYCTVLLQLLTYLANLLRKTVKEVQRRAIGIKRGHR